MIVMIGHLTIELCCHCIKETVAYRASMEGKKLGRDVNISSYNFVKFGFVCWELYLLKKIQLTQKNSSKGSFPE